MTNDLKHLKIALVCDWLTETGGAEKVLEQVSRTFPDAPIFTSQFRAKSAPKYFMGRDVRSGWLNVLPRGLRKFISPLRYVYFSHLKLREYDLIVSINNAEAKNISRQNMKPGAIHVSYLQGPPTQYYWREYDRYIKNPGFGKLNFLARIGLKTLVKPLRKIDYAAAQKPDVLLANSHYVADEIHTFYHRDATALWPNVDTETFTKLAQKVDARTKQKLRQELFDGQPFFITAGRQVNWKRLDIAIDFAKKTGQNLLLVGDGAEHVNLVARANGAPNIKFLPHYNGATDIAKYFVAARAFLFTSLEPFGITPVECLACGTPVIAFSSGGSRDFIQDGQNGVFFDGQNAESLAKAVTRFSKIKWNQSHVRQSATQFSNDNFVKSLKVILNEVYTTHLYK